jgi:hypothetical protein
VAGENFIPVFFTKYYNEQIKKNELVGACRMQGREEILA